MINNYDWHYIKDEGFPTPETSREYAVLYDSGEISEAFWTLMYYINYDGEWERDPDYDYWDKRTPEPESIIAYSELPDPNETLNVIKALEYILRDNIHIER